MSRIISSSLPFSLLFLCAGSALAADPVHPSLVAPPGNLPAVSALNGKFGAFGGSIDGTDGWGLVGAVSVPLARQWGAQVDAIAGVAGGASFTGFGGHLFWRDPSQGLLGLYGSYVDWQPIGANVAKVGVEGEVYRGPVTFTGFVGSQTGDFTGIAANATVAYYLQPNLRLDASFRFLNGLGNTAALGAEWQSDNSGLAFFGNGSWADGGHSTAIVGVKFYAGPQKSLIRRQREDDPGVELPLDLFHKPFICLQNPSAAPVQGQEQPIDFCNLG